MTAVSPDYLRGAEASLDASEPRTETAIPLSLRLRGETAALHREIEGLLGFPQRIADIASYRSCLLAYFRFYRTVETSLWRFPDWAATGIPLVERLQTPRLVEDLRALRVDPSLYSAAEPQWVPAMPDFAHALGVFYVLEGSTLGGQFILRHLREVLGDQIHGADAFFSGHGPRSGAMWNIARTAIDAYGEQHPESCDSVVEGAASAFRAVGAWMLHNE